MRSKLEIDGFGNFGLPDNLWVTGKVKVDLAETAKLAKKRRGKTASFGVHSTRSNRMPSPSWKIFLGVLCGLCEIKNYEAHKNAGQKFIDYERQVASLTNIRACDN